MLDSGAFTQINRYGGWKQTPEEYLERAYLLADKTNGSLSWAAPQDWMCEPDAIKATGLSVQAHQELTIENYLELKELDDRDLIIPCLQGWLPEDHLNHVEMYRAAGVELTELPLVGVGTICRRQDTDEIGALVGSLCAAGIRMHGFGVKAKGLALYGSQLVSADSMAWSYSAARKGHEGRPRLCGNPAATHKTCNSCYEWAHIWYERTRASC